MFHLFTVLFTVMLIVKLFQSWLNPRLVISKYNQLYQQLQRTITPACANVMIYGAHFVGSGKFWNLPSTGALLRLLYKSFKVIISCFDLGCVGFLTNSMLYSRDGIRCGFILIVIGLTITSILTFTWWCLVIIGYNGAWIVYVTCVALGVIFFITKIVVQHKIRVSFLEKQREKGQDSWSSTWSSIYDIKQKSHLKSCKGALPNYESCCQTCCCMTFCTPCMYGQMQSAINKYQCWYSNQLFFHGRISTMFSRSFCSKYEAEKVSRPNAPLVLHISTFN